MSGSSIAAPLSSTTGHGSSTAETRPRGFRLNILPLPKDISHNATPPLCE